ncbi:MAG: ATP-binding protein [Pseudomonadota bacterium]|jgi:PAS domain S-box-containing protein
MVWRKLNSSIPLVGLPHLRAGGYLAKVLILVALATLCRALRHLALSDWDPDLSLVLFYPVVMFGVWFGGFSLGAATTLLLVALLAGSMHQHVYSGVAGMPLALATLALEGLLASFIFDRLLRQRDSMLQERLSNVEAFIGQAPAAMAMFDREMRYIAASRRWLSDFNIGIDDVCGRSHYEIFPEIPERWKLVHQRCLAGATERADEDIFIRGDGSRQWISWEVQPWFRNESTKEIGGIIIFSEDITAIKEAYEHEGELRAQAEVESALRVEAQRSVQEKDAFVATLSHELRTPLNAMLGWTQLLRKMDSNPARQAKALSAIERSGQALNQLISDLLDINRIVSGKMRLNVAEVSIPSLVQMVLDTVQRELEEKELHVELHLDQPEPGEQIVSGDPLRLQQCLWNLLSNAIKFTPDGGRITVSTHGDQETVAISVADTGCGIPSDMLPRIFDRFVQSDSSSTRAHGGLGLGLAIVRQLVELHGGTVVAESKGRNQGSTFTIALPRVAPSAAPQSIAFGSSVVDADVDLRGISFLVIDDQLEARELLRGALEDRGAQVYTAPSAESALALTSREQPDLLISDIAMPMRDGYDYIRNVRQAGICTPAIALSAHAAADDEQRAIGAGFDRYLAKPVRLEQLFNTINELLQGRTLQQVV